MIRKEEGPFKEADENSSFQDPAEFILDQAPPVPEVAYDLQVVRSLRRLIRAADIFSRQLIKQHKITGPQLMCLHKLLEHDGLTVSGLSKEIYLSASTVVGILDRLERQELITRIRSKTDRRKVLIHVTQRGRDLVIDAPSPLQRALQKGLSELNEKQQRQMADTLADLVSMLEIDHIDAAPMLELSERLADHEEHEDTGAGI